MEYAKLQTAAKEGKVHFRTILAWANTGKIKYIVLPRGARQYELPAKTPINQRVIGYIRVSSHSQKQRLLRFGFEFIEKLLAKFGCELVVLNKLNTSPEQELVQDILAIVHVLRELRKYSHELKKLQNVTQSSAEETNQVLDQRKQNTLQPSNK